jgi:erythromycin esterase-like protein
MSDTALVNALREAVRPLAGGADDWDFLLERIGDRPVVLLGEASHGTREFYAVRAEITRRLIVERGFNGVCWEADWPDAARVHRYILGASEEASSERALGGFRRFPTWMWRNREVLAFVSWLRDWNAGPGIARGPRAGIYGLDLYAMHAAIDEVLRYLRRVDPEAAREARDRYSCLDHVRADPSEYAMVLLNDRLASCEPGVVRTLVELFEKRAEYVDRWPSAEDEYFFAVQNARVVRNAEAYYRTMYRGGATSWNLRDRHMAETFDELAEHLRNAGRPPKLVVWAHNSHLGDARATQMARSGEINLGQLLAEEYGDDVVRVGFTTYDGTVTAAHEWGEASRRYRVNPALPGSVEDLFHRIGGDFALDLGRLGEAGAALTEPRLERAIGVIYRPATERWSHYFEVRLPSQFDVVLHFDRTHALEPLDRGALWQPDEFPEAFPTGL